MCPMSRWRSCCRCNCLPRQTSWQPLRPFETSYFVLPMLKRQYSCSVTQRSCILKLRKLRIQKQKILGFRTPVCATHKLHLLLLMASIGCSHRELHVEPSYMLYGILNIDLQTIICQKLLASSNWGYKNRKFPVFAPRFVRRVSSTCFF